MIATIPMDKAGRIVLPKPMRKLFRLEEGGKLRVETIGNHLELTPILEEEPPRIVKKNGLLVVSANGTPCDALEALQADREDRETVLTKRT